MKTLEFENIDELEFDMDIRRFEYLLSMLDIIELGIKNNSNEVTLAQIQIKQPVLWWEIKYEKTEWVNLLKDLELAFVSEEMYEECVRVVKCLDILYVEEIG